MLPSRAINYLIKLQLLAIKKKTTFGLLARVMQALTLGYIQEIEDKFPILKTPPEKTRFYGTRGCHANVQRREAINNPTQL